MLDPGGILLWLLAGLIAGALASRVVSGRGHGCLGDVVIGVAGALIGGIVLSYFVHGTLRFWGSVIVAFIGAVILLTLLRLISPRR